MSVKVEREVEWNVQPSGSCAELYSFPLLFQDAPPEGFSFLRDRIQGHTIAPSEDLSLWPPCFTKTAGGAVPHRPDRSLEQAAMNACLLDHRNDRKTPPLRCIIVPEYPRFPSTPKHNNRGEPPNKRVGRAAIDSYIRSFSRVFCPNPMSSAPVTSPAGSRAGM